LENGLMEYRENQSGTEEVMVLLEISLERFLEMNPCISLRQVLRGRRRMQLLARRLYVPPQGSTFLQQFIERKKHLEKHRFFAPC
jgi:hypothetical protein